MPGKSSSHQWQPGGPHARVVKNKMGARRKGDLGGSACICAREPKGKGEKKGDKLKTRRVGTITDKKEEERGITKRPQEKNGPQ